MAVAQYCGGSRPAAAVEVLSERAKGKLRRFDSTKGSDFITPDIGGGNLYFQQPSLKVDGRDGYCSLNIGDSDEFDIMVDWDGCSRACNITAIGGGVLTSSFHPDGGSHGCGDARYGKDNDLGYGGATSYDGCSGRGFYSCIGEVAALPMLSAGNAHQVFDEMPLPDVVWDEELLHEHDPYSRDFYSGSRTSVCYGGSGDYSSGRVYCDCGELGETALLVRSTSGSLVPPAGEVPTNCSTMVLNSGHEKNGGGNCCGVQKLPFPKFYGDYPYIWKAKCLEYFRNYNISKCMWVIAAAMHMEGDAEHWWQMYKSQHGLGSWNQFMNAVEEKFGTNECQQARIGVYTCDEEIVMDISLPPSPPCELIRGDGEETSMCHAYQVFAEMSDQGIAHQMVEGMLASYPEQEALVICDDNEMFDEMPHDPDLQDDLLQQVAGGTKCTDEEVVKWDDELQHDIDNDSHKGLLKQLAGCANYMVDEETKPIENPSIHDESPHVNGTQFPLELLVNAFSDVSLENEVVEKSKLDSVVWDRDAQELLDEWPCENVVWDEELQLHCDSHVSLLEQLPNSRGCFRAEETKLVAMPVNANVFTQLVQHGDYQFPGLSMLSASTDGSFYEDVVQDKHFVNPLLSRLTYVIGLQVSMQLKVAEVGQGLNGVDQFGGNLMGLRRLFGQVVGHIPLSMKDLFSPEGDCRLWSKLKQIFSKLPPWRKCALRSGWYTAEVDYSMLCQTPSCVCGGFSPWSKVSDKALRLVLFAGTYLMDVGCKRPHIVFRQWDPGILGYAASNTYDISNSALFIRSSVMLLMPSLQILNPFWHDCWLQLSTCADNLNEQKAQLAVEFVDVEVLTHVGSLPLFLELGIDSAERMTIEMCNLEVENDTLIELEQQHHKSLTNISGPVASAKSISVLEKWSELYSAHDFITEDAKQKFRRPKYVSQMNGVAWGQATFRRGGSVTHGPYSLAHASPQPNHSPIQSRQ